MRPSTRCGRAWPVKASGPVRKFCGHNFRPGPLASGSAFPSGSRQLREVEDLLHDHEAIDEVAVIGVEDEQFGQRLKAFVVRCGGSSVSEDDLRDYVKANLARYKVPREIVFLDELPRNATGKVLKRDLAERG